jgi:hypothetical protein
MAAFGFVKGVALATVVPFANSANTLDSRFGHPFAEHPDGGSVLEPGHHLREVRKGILRPSFRMPGATGEDYCGLGLRLSMSIFLRRSSSLASRLIRSSFSLESALSFNVSSISPTTNFASAAYGLDG